MATLARRQATSRTSWRWCAIGLGEWTQRSGRSPSRCVSRTPGRPPSLLTNELPRSALLPSAASDPSLCAAKQQLRRLLEHGGVRVRDDCPKSEVVRQSYPSYDPLSSLRAPRARHTPVLSFPLARSLQARQVLRLLRRGFLRVPEPEPCRPRPIARWDAFGWPARSVHALTAVPWGARRSMDAAVRRAFPEVQSLPSPSTFESRIALRAPWARALCTTARPGTAAPAGEDRSPPLVSAGVGPDELLHRDEEEGVDADDDGTIEPADADRARASPLESGGESVDVRLSPTIERPGSAAAESLSSRLFLLQGGGPAQSSDESIDLLCGPVHAPRGHGGW